MKWVNSGFGLHRISMLKSYAHPILWLFTLNTATIAFVSSRLAWSDMFSGLLLPLGFLWMLSATLRTGGIRTNFGPVNRLERPLAFRFAVGLLFLLYVATSLVPFGTWLKNR